MRRKGFLPEEVESAVEQGKKARLLDDARFAELFVRSLLASKPVGARWLKGKLKQRGVADAIIADTLEHANIASEEESLARRATLRYQRSHPSHAEDRQRLVRFLLTRGFSMDAVEKALQKKEE